MPTSVAPADGGFTLRACSMPGSLTSTAHFSEPSTFDGMSSRRGDWPTLWSSCTLLILATPVVASTLFPVNATLNRLPPMSAP